MEHKKTPDYKNPLALLQYWMSEKKQATSIISLVLFLNILQLAGLVDIKKTVKSISSVPVLIEKMDDFGLILTNMEYRVTKLEKK